MRVAFVHDWLVVYAGSERLLEQMLAVFPEADLFSLVDFLPPCERRELFKRNVRTSFIQKLPFAKKVYRHYLPFMPLAIEQFDMSGYDLVISSSHAVAKGIITSPDQLHLCMCCSPIRYAWDLQHQYLRESNLEKGIKGFVAKWLLHKIRLWDYRTANGVDQFMAISHFIKRRIKKVYGRDSKVIYPPVDVEAFTFQSDKEDFFLTSSRMVPYKKIDLIVEAFGEMPHKKLFVIGDGPDFNKIKAKARSNVTLLGYQPFETLRDYMQRAKAFIFAAKEDFGIIPIEAQACGTPVIGFAGGALLETIRGLDLADPTGCFFKEQTIKGVVEAVEKFEQFSHLILPENCRKNALKYSPERFRSEFKEFVMHSWTDYLAQQRIDQLCNP